MPGDARTQGGWCLEVAELEAADDPTIADEAHLWRRVTPDWLVFDANLGCRRLSSQAFQNLEADRLSVLLAQMVEESGRTPADVLSGYPGYSLASVLAGFARQHQQMIVRAPEAGEPAHCHMVGKKPKAVQKALAKHAVWVLPPESL